MSESSSNPMREAIQSAISDNPVILFMKGTPDAPACGFSARTVAMLESLDQPFPRVTRFRVRILPQRRVHAHLRPLRRRNVHDLAWATRPRQKVRNLHQRRDRRRKPDPLHSGPLRSGLDPRPPDLRPPEMLQPLEAQAEVGAAFVLPPARGFHPRSPSAAHRTNAAAISTGSTARRCSPAS